VRSGRGLLDNYGESLKFVNKLLNSEFGSAPRRVPAHMPHYIQVDVMERLQAKWPEQWNRTSSNRLRSPSDMQYAFAYYYYMMHERVPYNYTELFQTVLDVDGDGYDVTAAGTLSLHVTDHTFFRRVLSKNELRTVAVSTLDSSFLAGQIDQFMDSLVNCTENFTLPVTQELLRNHCTKAYSKVEKKWKLRLKNKYALPQRLSTNRTYPNHSLRRFELSDGDEVAFVMVRTNATNVLHSIDGIRQRKQKFVCLNDNLNHSNPHAQEVLTVVKDFYESLFPHPSPFELPDNEFNTFLYVDDLLAAFVPLLFCPPLVHRSPCSFI
jgi:UDP-N-acetylglucosamine-lysosomal-enzyme